MRTCGVPSCPNNIVHRPDLKYFSFPRHPSIRAEWLEVVDIKYDKNPCICEIHFKKKDFRNGATKSLKDHAVPLLHLGGKSAKKDIDSDEEFVGYGSDCDEKEKRQKLAVASALKRPDSSDEDERSESPLLTLPSGRPSRRAARAACKKIYQSCHNGTVSDSTGTVSDATDYEPKPAKKPKIKKVYQLQEYQPGSLSVEMECEEEYLSSVQAQYFFKLNNEFNVMMRNLRDLNAQGVRIIQKEDSGDVVYQPYTRLTEFKGILECKLDKDIFKGSSSLKPVSVNVKTGLSILLITDNKAT